MIIAGPDFSQRCFWLKEKEDPDPAEAEPYARWRELRKLQEQHGSDDTAATQRRPE